MKKNLFRAKTAAAVQSTAPHRSPWLRNTVVALIFLGCSITSTVMLREQHNMFSSLALAQEPAAAAQPASSEIVASVAAEPGIERTLTQYLARRYRVSADVTAEIVEKAYAIGRDLELEPTLILAVIAVESRFNPIAESAKGAKGLMQVIPRFHPEKFDASSSEKTVFDTATNIAVGSRILKEYLRYTGDLADALKMYAGALTLPDDNGYAEKVTRERERLNDILERNRPRPSAAAL